VHFPGVGLLVHLGLAIVVAGGFLTIQFTSWRSSGAVVGASRAFALTSTILVLSDVLAYTFVLLAQAGRVPAVAGHLLGGAAFVWFTLALFPIPVLVVVELILVLEIPVSRKCRTPVHLSHVGALVACGAWLVILDTIGRMSAK